MTSPPSEEPWERAGQFAELALGRSSWVRLSSSSEDELTALLRQGWSRAKDESRQDEWDDSVSSLINTLIRKLGERGYTSGIEYKDDRVRDNRRPLPPEAFSDAIRSICPLWPFC